MRRGFGCFGRFLAPPGPDAMAPPSTSQALQVPSKHPCTSASSLPRAKTSSRPGAHDRTTAGIEFKDTLCPHFVVLT
ncbi:hypothetical protein ACMHYB_05935 [Sorangium sp. So ce1128]